VICADRVSLAWFFGNGWVNGGKGEPGVDVSGALGNVWSYDFGDYEVVYYCVIHVGGVGRRGGVFLIFICGVVGGG